MLRKIKFHNFKTFLNAEVDLASRQLLVGRNNSGKTNFANGLRFLSLTAKSDLREAAKVLPGGAEEMFNWHLMSNELEIACTAELPFDGSTLTFNYELRLVREKPRIPSPARDVELRVGHERLVVDGGGYRNLPILENDGRHAVMVHEEQALNNDQPHQSRTMAPNDATMLSKLYQLDGNPRMILFRDYLRGWGYHSPSPFAIRLGAGQHPATHFAALDPEAGLLSNAIFHLKNVNERRYRRMIEHAQIVEPALQAILFVPVPDRPPVPFVEIQGRPSASWTGLSDGTLRMLALALIIEVSAALSPPEGRTPVLTMIEEPENGLFLGELRRIFDLFDEWAPNAQFLFTSHSASFIDFFDDRRGEVLILKRATDRSEFHRPPPAEPPDRDDRFSLSMEYASELFE